MGQATFFGRKEKRNNTHRKSSLSPFSALKIYTFDEKMSNFQLRDLNSPKGVDYKR